MADDSLQDRITARQIQLERLKTSVGKEYVKTILPYVNALAKEIAGRESELSEETRKAIKEFEAEVKRDMAEVIDEANAEFTETSEELAPISQANGKTDIVRGSAGFIKPSAVAVLKQEQLVRQVMNRPIQATGQLFPVMLSEFKTGEIRKMNRLIIQGIISGQTNTQIAQAIRGTVSLNRRDGQVAKLERAAQTMVHTAIQHVDSTSKAAMYRVNKDILSGYEFNAVLDRKTSAVCKGLDGEVFPLDKKGTPQPPIHPNCRSTLLPIVKGLEDTDDTRASESGATKAKDYYTWLKRQPKAVQVEALGKSRAEIFRAEGMTADRFKQLSYNRNFEPLTLNEMKEKAGKLGYDLPE